MRIAWEPEVARFDRDEHFARFFSLEALAHMLCGDAFKREKARALGYYEPHCGGYYLRAIRNDVKWRYSGSQTEEVGIDTSYLW